MQIADCLARALELKSISDTWRLDTELLLAEVLTCNRALLLTHPERELVAAQQSRFAELMTRRLKGEPVAYLLGRQEFWSLELQVNAAVLIPRPETELLVEMAIERALNVSAGESNTEPEILDLGTGSGAIALALASELPAARVLAVDNSPAALAVAQGNASRLGLHPVRFLLSDWFESLGGQKFHLVISNPPYVAAQDAHLQSGDLRFEPHQALVSGGDGLDDIRRLVSDAGEHLHKGGWLLLEHGWQQGAAVRSLLLDAGYSRIDTKQDLAGLDRVSSGQYDP